LARGTLADALALSRALTVAECLFIILLRFPGNVPWRAMFNLHPMEENNMKKLGYVFAALGAIAIAAPSIASAEDVVIKGGNHDRGARAEYREHRDRGWHEGWRHRHADKVVIVKHRHHGD
jgi:hypothetical protein